MTDATSINLDMDKENKAALVSWQNLEKEFDDDFFFVDESENPDLDGRHRVECRTCQVACFLCELFVCGCWL